MIHVILNILLVVNAILIGWLIYKSNKNFWLLYIVFIILLAYSFFNLHTESYIPYITGTMVFIIDLYVLYQTAAVNIVGTTAYMLAIGTFLRLVVVKAGKRHYSSKAF